MSPEIKPTWDGIYISFAEAGGEHAVFESAIWMGKIVGRARAALERSSGGAIPPVALTTDYALSFIAASAARRAHALRILDFGGGMATSYVPLRAMLPRDQAVDFVIVENEAITRQGNELFAADPGVTFRSDLPVPSERFEIIHFGSSLQYVDDWKGLLATVTAFQPEYLLFADLTAADNRSFVTIQQWHERRIPVHLWNVDEFVATVCALGYELLLKSRYRGYYLGPDAELPTANFDPEHRLTYTSQLVFRRARATKEE